MPSWECLLAYARVFLMNLTRYTVLTCILACSLFGQTATLMGVVTDESGAVVPGAKIGLKGPNADVKETASGPDGSYSLTALSPGTYALLASAPDLALLPVPRILLKPGLLRVNIQMKVASTVQQVTVEENTGPTVTPDPANNATALVLRGEDLQALSDDPDDLAAELQALAGPAAGPNGGAIYVDGFSGGQLPSKESIREIRVNQNPFSPEFDKLGFGRIEIFTKPGTDKFHGSAFYNISDSIWNSRNPYASQKAPFRLQEFGGSLAGPINKRSSFFLDVRRDSVDNGAIINAVDPESMENARFTQVFLVPQRRLFINPRIDYQLSANNTLVARFTNGDVDIPESGIGSFNLISRGYHSHSLFNILQLTETAVIAGVVINEARFQFYRLDTDLLANSPLPAISVPGAFNGGGAQVGHSTAVQHYDEFSDYVSISKKAHSWKFGARVRFLQDTSSSRQNFGGTFTFDSIEQYRRTVLGQPGGGATQFSFSQGKPLLSVDQIETGIFVGDDWRVRPNITVSLGLRYEIQTNISDRGDFAPRVGIAWAPGASNGKARPKTVIRAGFGTFYDRFALANTITALRYGGAYQQQFILKNPGFFKDVPPLDSLPGLQAGLSTQSIAKDLRASYILQSALSVERQLPKNTTLAVTYANSHGLHLLRSRNTNSALAGTYDPNIPDSGVYPLGTPASVIVAESVGLYNQNQLIVNTNSKVNANISLFGNYMFNHALSNTDGIGTFPARPYNYTGEYGPASTDVHHRMALGGSVNTWWNVRVSPFIILESGLPFDITTGRDLFGDTLFNSRPGIATDLNKPGVISTKYGFLDPNPTDGEKILGRNSGRGPGGIRVNVRLNKTFGFGPAKEGSASAISGPLGGGGGGVGNRGQGGVFSTGGGGPGGPFSASPTSRRFNLIVGISAQNLINHNNPGPIIGNITSPLFGQANQAAGGGGQGFSESANNRRIELQLRLTF